MTYSENKCWKRQVKLTILGFLPLYCCSLLLQGQNLTYPVKVREGFWGSSLVAQSVKNPPAMQETPVQSLGQEESLEKEMATHGSILAWEIPWIEEPGGLQSMGSQRVRHDWATKPPARILTPGYWWFWQSRQKEEGLCHKLPAQAIVNLNRFTTAFDLYSLLHRAF